MGETVPRRNVSFEEGVKGYDLLSSKTGADLPKSPSKLSSSDGDSDGKWLVGSPSRSRTTVDSSLGGTPRGPGSPLPLNFLFRHLSGIKSTLAEAMEVAQMSCSSAAETASSSTSGGLFAQKHSYSRIKHRRPKGTAVRTTNSFAIVTSLMLHDEDPSETLEESKNSKPRRGRKFYKNVVTKDVRGRQKIGVHKNIMHVDTNFKRREGRHTRRRKTRGISDQKKQALLYASRRLGFRKWDVQTALGPLLQLEENKHSGGLGDLTTFPKLVESLIYCADGAWRWRECVLVGSDSSSGMYQTVRCEDASGEPWGSQNLSGYTTQTSSGYTTKHGSGYTTKQGGTPLCDSNSGSTGVSLENSPSWRSKLSSRFGSSLELDHDPKIPMRLVARLNIRLPQEPQAPRVFTDQESDWKSMTPKMQPASLREPTSAGANDFDGSSRDYSLKALKLQCRLRSEDIPTYSSTQGSVRHGQSYNVPSHCSTQGSARHGHVASEVSVSALKQALKPLYGVESRLGVGMNGGTSEKSMSTRRLSVSGKSDGFMLPGEFNTGANAISENVMSWRRKGRPESAKCIVYDLFPLLSEIAQEFEHVASLTECTDITSLAKAGMLLPNRNKLCPEGSKARGS